MMRYRLFHPSWSPDQVTGEVKDRATSQRLGVADNRADSTSSLDTHRLYVLEFILHQKLLSRALAKLRSMLSFS